MSRPAGPRPEDGEPGRWQAQRALAELPEACRSLLWAEAQRERQAEDHDIDVAGRRRGVRGSPLLRGADEPWLGITRSAGAGFRVACSPGSEGLCPQLGAAEAGQLGAGVVAL